MGETRAFKRRQMRYEIQQDLKQTGVSKRQLKRMVRNVFRKKATLHNLFCVVARTPELMR